MDGCLPCKCGSERLIPDYWISEPSVMRIRCIDCDTTTDEKKETLKEAVLEWNKKVSRY